MKQVIDSPFSEGKAHLQHLKETTEYRGEMFTYEHTNYRCDETGLEFTTDDMDFDNLEQVYAQYRERHNIPSPAELTAMRERYGLSAIKMAQVLGLGVNQYAKYEQGEMPSESIGKMLRSIQTPAVFMGYLEDAKNQFSEAEYKKICAKVQKSFLKLIKSKPDLSWFWELLTPPRVLGRVAL
ncbi:MAG: hypothetical protein IK073_02230 [Paludibacteraceae bacterium]|nr:hypothetical protein [Paludibacteraceae bacterium]